MVRELISREAVRIIVKNAGDKSSISLYKQWDEARFKLFAVEAIYTAINSIDKETLRTFLKEG